ncbi:MAG: 3-phosphoshikimate 1-carboxyvinyltransferase [Alphaproteobacteria bacterium]|nr:3-phosphoshikimate 1-carboxyvinyltransferase [Alphaproteobacteria bacterium]MBU2270319.1 3-phosphoshikimate 1-carboxyvinyltransferase [Alphaproteobacteria bacterium]
MSGPDRDQARFRHLFSPRPKPSETTPDALKNLVFVLARLDDVVVEAVVVLVLDEGHGVVVIVVGQDVVLAGFAHAGLFRRIDRGLVVVVVRGQDRLVAFLVDLGRGDGFFLVVIVIGRLLLGDLILGVFLGGLVGGVAGRTAAAVAQLKRLLRIEIGRAFGAVGRAAAQVVEFGLAVRADLLLAQFGIGHGVRPLAGVGNRARPLPPWGAAVKSHLSRRPRRLTLAGDRRVPVPSTLTAASAPALSGVTRAPGDKSMSHRALILGAMATGVTDIDGLLEGDDVLATARAVEAFGAGVERLGEGRWRVTGHGGFRQPDGVIDCGNAGTGVRLLMGAAAGYPITVTFDGDASLRKRPMMRVIEPLQLMGARFEGDRLPLVMHGGGLKGIHYVMPVASAQVKSAILLAGQNASGGTIVEEPVRTRDHTEKMLRAFDAPSGQFDGIEPYIGPYLALSSGGGFAGTAVSVPGDPSSAAFPLAAALIVPGSEVTVEGVMLNPLRTGLFETWREMGADLTVSNRRMAGGEEVGDVTARHSKLHGVVVPPERAASMIDEYPVLAATAAFADGATVMRGIGEMRLKESDRIALMAAGLQACGVAVEEEPEGFTVTGGPVQGGATVVTHGDHRIAMSHLVLGLAAAEPVTVDEPGMIATSFPGFVDLMRGLGADIAAA